MRLKRIKKLKVNCYDFKVKWDKTVGGASFSYRTREIVIGTIHCSDAELFMVVCHELWEICAVEMNCRMQRPDCEEDYIFVYDHRQFDTMTTMFSGLLPQFIE